MCSAAFWHFPAVGRVFADLARVLAPGGVFAFNVPAAQLSDVVDAAPAPLQLALAREGERRFGRPPAPGGPVLRRTDLLDRAAEAGLARRADGRVDVFAPQQELLDLLGTPAIGARLYPNSSGSERRTLIQAVAARVDLAEKVPLRWCEFLFQRA